MGTAPPNLILRSVSASGTAAREIQHQGPEGVRAGQKRRLYLHLLSNPGNGLLLSLGQRTAPWAAK
jgi:hypothetical protein